MAKPKPAAAKAPAKKDKPRTYLSQSDVPLYSLDKALKIPEAIVENYGKGPAKPVEIARVLQVAPSTTSFKMQTGASIAYGLTDGGWNAAQIALTPLGKKILRPEKEDEPLEGKREALLKPRVISEFLTKYNDAVIPRDDIAFNVLEGISVPRERTADVLKLIMDGATSVGFITESAGKKHVNLKGAKPVPITEKSNAEMAAEAADLAEAAEVFRGPDIAPVPSTGAADSRLTKVFISHGKNKAFIDPIKKLLAFGQLEAVVSVEKSTVSVPVTQKVMSDMRSCGAAIIHVESERRLIDPETKEQFSLNENVLIEIGAAMALYGERYILLVKEGVKLPSNLQGLFEVRFSGDTLNGDETIKLMGAINDMKTKKLP